MPHGPTGALPPEHPVVTWNDLVLFLGGQPGSDDEKPSFTGLLAELIAKADPGNKARLRLAFPREVTAWEIWFAFGSEQKMTAAELAELVDGSGAEQATAAAAPHSPDPEGPETP